MSSNNQHHNANPAINPSHYKNSFGVECIEIARQYSYSHGNAIKYAWRAGKKDDLLQDLQKCLWYCKDEAKHRFCNPPVSAINLFKEKAYGKFNNYPLQNELLNLIIEGKLAHAIVCLEDIINSIATAGENNE